MGSSSSLSGPRPILFGLFSMTLCATSRMASMSSSSSSGTAAAESLRDKVAASSGFAPSLLLPSGGSTLSPSSFLLPSATILGEEDPLIESSPNVSVSIGRTAYIRCKITNLGHKSVSWVRHNDVGLISVGKFQYIRDPRFKIVHAPRSQEWLLVIRAVRFGDEGPYECQVNTSPIRRETVYLTVVEPFTEILGGSDVFIDQHSTINLTCLVHTPDKPAHVFWLRNGKPLIPSTSWSPSSPKDLSSPSYSAAESAAADSRVTIARTLSPDLSSTVSQLIVRGARPSDSGAYNCSPSNTKPASLTVHVLDGESTDALQTSGLSAFTASKSYNFILVAALLLSAAASGTVA